MAVSAEHEARYNIDGFDTTVRGVIANEYQQGPEDGNPVPRSGISWIEDSLLMILTASSDAQPNRTRSATTSTDSSRRTSSGNRSGSMIETA